MGDVLIAKILASVVNGTKQLARVADPENIIFRARTRHAFKAALPTRIQTIAHQRVSGVPGTAKPVRILLVYVYLVLQAHLCTIQNA